MKDEESETRDHGDAGMGKRGDEETEAGETEKHRAPTTLMRAGHLRSRAQLALRAELREYLSPRRTV